MTTYPSTLTVSDIRNWAKRKKKSKLPAQLENLENIAKYSDLLLSLVIDKTCPKRIEILNCLYTHIGTTVSQHKSEDIDTIETLLTKAAAHDDVILLNLVTRSRMIIADLRKYDYVEWREGGFVKKDLPL